MEVNNIMGMTDKQFASYQKRLLRELEGIIEGMPDGKERDRLQRLIDDLREELSRP